MTTEYSTDIAPAISELKKLHGLLLDHITEVENVDPKGLKSTRETVISILPGDRRREDGWYKWRVWAKKSDSILHELDKQYKEQKYHEIYVSGESLSGSMEDIVYLMMHQVCHQGAEFQSTQSYHGEWIKIWHKRLFQIDMDAWGRDEVLGWYNLDKSKVGADAAALVSRLAAQLVPHSFDLFRIKTKKSESTGKMNKWTCGCKESPAVRTGGILVATCGKCNNEFKIHPKGVRASVLNRVPVWRRWET